MRDEGLALVAKIMLAVFTALGVFSIGAMIRSFFRPLDATAEKVSAAKRAFLYSSWVLIGAVAGTINALMSQQYYLLGASALLFSFVLPIAVHYLRLKAALNRASRREQAANLTRLS